MGKLTLKDATDLVDKEILSKSKFKELQDEGFITKRGSSSERYMKSKDGKWTSPTLYFKGLKKDGVYTKKMVDLKSKINKIIKEHTITKDEMKGVSSNEK